MHRTFTRCNVRISPALETDRKDEFRAWLLARMIGWATNASHQGGKKQEKGMLARARRKKHAFEKHFSLIACK